MVLKFALEVSEASIGVILLSCCMFIFIIESQPIQWKLPPFPGFPETAAVELGTECCANLRPSRAYKHEADYADEVSDLQQESKYISVSCTHFYSCERQISV